MKPYRRKFRDLRTAPRVPHRASVLRADVKRNCHVMLVAAALAAGGAPVPAGAQAEFDAGGPDAGPAINSALRTRQHVLLPCGQYRIQTPIRLSSGMSLKGTSRTCVTLLAVNPTDNLIEIGDRHGVTSEAELEAVHIFAPAARRGGFAVVVRRGHFVRLSDITIDGPQAGGVQFDGTGGGSFGNRLEDFEISSAAQTGISITGYSTDTFIDQGVVGASPTSLHVDDASGVYLSNLDLSPATGNADGRSRANILVDPRHDQNVNAFRADHVLSDSCDGDCWRFAPGTDGSTGGITEVQITGSWGSGAIAGNGLVVAQGAAVDGMIITGFDAHLNALNGVMIDGGGNIAISDLQAFNNARSSNIGETGCRDADYSGVVIGSRTTAVTLLGVQAGVGGYMKQHGKLNCQSFGLDAGLGGAASRILTLIGGQFTGNRSGGTRIPPGPGTTDLGIDQR